MGQVARVTTGSGTLEDQMNALRQQMNEVLLVVDDHIEFGEPQNPNDPTSTTLAGATGVDAAHNGTISNVNGSWVEILLTAAGTSVVTCTHNLFLDPVYTVPVPGEPNCRWLPFGFIHDGTGGDATSGLSITPGFISGNTVTASAIDLSISVITDGTALTIDGNHPLRVTLFFIKGTQGA
jgi:hypothetical protein